MLIKVSFFWFTMNVTLEFENIKVAMGFGHQSLRMAQVK